jgi:hypothetical protein
MADATQPATKPKCNCTHCRMRGLMGPVMLITVGVLFLMGEFTRYGFGDLWPVLLLVSGLVILAQSTASREGHTGA